MVDRPRIEIQVPPDVLGMLFRVGAAIVTKNGYTILLKEGGIPADYRLQKYGVDPETKQFVFRFAPRGQETSGPIIRQAPVYEKEEATHGQKPSA
jgi:hypothetical protein